MRDIEIALLVWCLLRIKVGLNCVCVVVEVLVDLLLSSLVVLVGPHLDCLTWILERWVYSDLIIEHRLVLSMLDAELLVLVRIDRDLHRGLAYMCLLNRSTLLRLQLDVFNIVHVHMLVSIMSSCAVDGMLQ